MFILTYLLIVPLSTAWSSKCPEDPFACLLRGHHTNSQFISIKLQEANNGDTEVSSGRDSDSLSSGASHPHRRSHQVSPSEAGDTSVHQDGRFSLNDTQAAGCGEEQTSNGTNGCKKCSSCPKNGKVIRSCSPEHDTMCMCERGTYLDILAYECKPCSPCAHGSGVFRKCNRHRDTECRPCMPGFYSAVLSNELSCTLCDTCTSNQIMLQECSRIENTVCIGESTTVVLFFSCTFQSIFTGFSCSSLSSLSSLIFSLHCVHSSSDSYL